MDEERESWIFTFGIGHRHPRTGQPLANHYVRIVGSYEAARAKMNERFGRDWAFVYRTLEQARGRRRRDLIELPFTSYDPGELLPPTEVELRRGRWTLQTVTHWHAPDERYDVDEMRYLWPTRARLDACSPTFDELHRVMIEHNIPRTARIETFFLDYEDAVCRVVWEAGS